MIFDASPYVIPSHLPIHCHIICLAFLNSDQFLPQIFQVSPDIQGKDQPTCCRMDVCTNSPLYQVCIPLHTKNRIHHISLRSFLLTVPLTQFIYYFDHCFDCLCILPCCPCRPKSYQAYNNNCYDHSPSPSFYHSHSTTIPFTADAKNSAVLSSLLLHIETPLPLVVQVALPALYE